MNCPSCGSEVPEGAQYCGKCGEPLVVPVYTEQPAQPMEWEQVTIHQKDPTAAFLLGLLPGLVGFWGIGHMYAGDVFKGLLILFTGWALIFITIFSGPFFLCFLVLGLVLWLVQAFDAYRTAVARNSGRRGWY